jgi:LCP family protein required for cell wall assembly
MKPPKINLLHPGRAERAGRWRFSFWKGALIGLLAVAVVVPTLFSVMSVRLLNAASRLNPERREDERLSLFEQVRHLVGNSEKRLRGEEDDRVNILVLGEGGEGHDGPHLTDTILLVTFKPSTADVGVLSLPRDLWIPLPGMGNGKINSANALAEKRREGSGGDYARGTIAELLDLPIHYYVRVDFSAFKTLIDDVGGVTVNVERGFTDYAYPTDDNLYKRVHFERGWQTMGGETALEYVRSRHGNNGEGSDFARSRRQQQVLVALKDKLVSFDTLLNPSRVASVLETLQSHVITDMELWEIVKLAKAVRHIDREKLVHHVLDDNPEGPLYASTIPFDDGDAYVLLPRREDWGDVRAIARDVLTWRAPQAADVRPERAPRVEIQNGTKLPGLAKKTQDLLTKVGYEVVRIGNAKEQEREMTVVYDLSNGGDPEALQTLQNLLNAQVALTVPGYLSSGLTPSGLAISNSEQPGASKEAEYLIVLGRNAAN